MQERYGYMVKVVVMMVMMVMRGRTMMRSEI
jgi:hypothetical protein